MREIKFRGYSMDNQKWVYGFYLKDTTITDWHYIIWFDEENDVFVRDEIYEESLGQYTGLKDKKGMYIFEGDILRYKSEFTSPFDGRTKLKIDSINTVTFREGAFMAERMNKFTELRYKIDGDDSSAEIIGNIYDNPELLEVQS